MNSGVIVRGVRTPIIKEGDDLAKIVIDSITALIKEEKVVLNDRDVIAITESVVAISKGNYATLAQIALDINNKFQGDKLVVLMPIFSRNRFLGILKALARSKKELVIIMNYPKDEVGNPILDEKKLKEHNFNPYSDTLTEDTYNKLFSDFRHPFTGTNIVSEYKKICQEEGCQVEILFSNNINEAKKHSKMILVASIHNRLLIKESLAIDKELLVYTLSDILKETINGSGFNKEYGLLGSNLAAKEKLKLFPNRDMALLKKIQDALFQIFNKKIEVMVYGDGAYKDPVGHIWELADPVVSPFYTPGLKGSPNEIKIKYLAGEKYANLSGNSLTLAIKQEIKKKGKDLKGTDLALGTTPRMYTDLLGSLADLVSGSGDKGTPVVLIQNYFKNYSDK